MKYTEQKASSLEDDAEKIAAIRKIRKLMDFWRISPHELRGRGLTVVPKAPPAEIRYRHPITGNTWDGQGQQPQWLREALIREGYTVDELRRAVNEHSSPVMVGMGELDTAPSMACG